MDELQSCELCFQPVRPFYQVRILPATPLDFCGGTVTPPHARIPGEHKIACHTCRYTFTNLEPHLEPDREPCSSEELAATFPHLEPDRESNLEPCSEESANTQSNLEPCSNEELADHVEDEPSVPIPVLPTPTPTLIGSPARPSRSQNLRQGSPSIDGGEELPLLIAAGWVEGTFRHSSNMSP